MSYNNFIFGSVNSATYGAYISAKKSFSAAERAVESYAVPGKNGHVLIDEGRYENIEVPYKVFFRDGFLINGIQFIDALKAQRGYQRFEDSVNSDIFREGYIASSIDVTPSQLAKQGYFDVIFNFKPQKFLKSGAEWQTVTANSTWTNPTNQEAFPLLRVYGEGTITFNGVGISVLNADGYTDIDCEICDAYKGSTNCNANVTQEDVFPSLPAGDTVIRFSGFTKVEMKPRWWRA